MSEIQIISRKEALALGLKRFYTGAACKHGHLCEKLVSNWTCIQCGEQKAEQWRKKNIDKNREKNRLRAEAYRRDNREKVRANWAAWRERNIEKHREWGRAYYAKNSKKMNETGAAWRLAKPEKVKACGTAYREAHPDKITAANKAYYAKSREKIFSYGKGWRNANPEKDRIAARKRYAANPSAHKAKAARARAARIKAEGVYTDGDIIRILNHQKSKCAYCRKSIKSCYHIDHVIPLAKGGSNFPRNLQLLCPKCNLSKGAHHPIAYAQQLGMLL